MSMAMTVAMVAAPASAPHRNLARPDSVGKAVKKSFGIHSGTRVLIRNASNDVSLLGILIKTRVPECIPKDFFTALPTESGLARFRCGAEAGAATMATVMAMDMARTTHTASGPV